ncbi:exodeoxyribonuclease V subunit alpha [Gracilimonas sp.]|uniref:exodeoxyribonuclease V subunit alpha n=1 Tax=Gracilimonas sp. TaxID=1974203 RepID=UPI003D12BF66
MMDVLPYLEKLLTEDVISLLELEFVRFLKQIEPDVKQEVLLAASACIFAQQKGHVCLDFEDWKDEYLFEDAKSEIKLTDSLKKDWNKALKESNLVSKGTELHPLVLEGSRLYLHRYWKYEEELCAWLKQKAAPRLELKEKHKKAIQSVLPPANDLFEVNWQHVAVQLSFLKDLLVISGGPGTGKTFTVLNIIAAQAQAHAQQDFRIALAAPTGKAARRLSESIESGKKNLNPEVLSGIEIPESALTVHKLLGSDFRGSTFKFNEENHLPYDLVVVDEASMLDINMWVRLIRAIGPNTKLIVLGDKDQLASVEAGSILGDICGGENTFSEGVSSSLRELQGIDIPVGDSTSPINDCILFLTKSYRFGKNSGIQKFAEAVNASDADKAIAILKDHKSEGLSWIEPDSRAIEEVFKTYVQDHYKDYSQLPEKQRLAASHKKKILCALRRGPFGVEYMNERAERLIRRNEKRIDNREWYDGRIVMATRNDSLLKVRNGEIGIYQKKGEVIEFEGDRPVRVSAARLKDYEPAFALTIHKSQGSEFDKVAIILPNQVNTVLSKEILYTAVTRARLSTLIIVKEEILRRIIERTVSRKSGVKQKLWE